MKRFLFFLLCLPLLVGAQVPERPDPPHLYNNLSKAFPDFLSPEQARDMEKELVAFDDSTGNQICVVIVDDLGGMDAAAYSFEIGNKWAVGTKKFNNGIVVLIKPTDNDGGRDLAIATGYGLEGAIPDLMTARVREEMVPYLKSGQNYEAIQVGTSMLMKMAKGEYHEQRKKRHNKNGLPWWAIVIIVIVALVFFGNGGGNSYSGRGRRRYWGGYSGWGGFGGGSFGGGSSGGFGGFGGGSFGGGGSSGKW